MHWKKKNQVQICQYNVYLFIKLFRNDKRLLRARYDLTFIYELVTIVVHIQNIKEVPVEVQFATF